MHKELLLPNLDIASAVSAALADEAAPVQAKRGAWRSVGRLAVAASVTVAVLAGVRLYNQDEIQDEITGAQLASQQPVQQGVSVPQVQGPAVLAGYTESSDQPTGPMANGVLQNQAGWDQRLPGYLRQHAQESALKGAENALPYARAASLEPAK